MLLLWLISETAAGSVFIPFKSFLFKCHARAESCLPSPSHAEQKTGSGWRPGRSDVLLMETRVPLRVLEDDNLLQQIINPPTCFCTNAFQRSAFLPENEAENGFLCLACSICSVCVEQNSALKRGSDVSAASACMHNNSPDMKEQKLVSSSSDFPFKRCPAEYLSCFCSFWCRRCARTDLWALWWVGLFSAPEGAGRSLES